jgi:tetratricopeptide (TPR) repeat protein
MKKTILAYVIVATMLAATAANALDSIGTHTQGTVRGRITGMSPLQVEIDVRGVVEKIPVNDIRAIRFDEEPEDLTDARVNIRSGEFFEAMKTLKEINLANVPDGPIKADIQFYFAYCAAQRALGGAEAIKDAYGYMQTFVKANPTNYHYFEANELMGDLLVAAGKPEFAARHYEEAAKAPWPDAQLRLAVARARAYQSENKHSQAIAEFEKVLSSGMAGELADRYRLAAKLGKAASLARARQGDQGLKLVNDVIRAAQKGDTEIHARAYNALGDCYMAMGDNKSAVMAYLHVDALYYQHPPLHAESLARMASLWDKLEKRDRAAGARKKLNSMYPNSKWAKAGA